MSYIDTLDEACARVKGQLPWNCDLGDLEKFGPGAIEYLEGLSRKHSQVNLFAQTIRLMRAFEGYLRTAAPSGAIRPEVGRRLVVRHDELIAGFEKELARLYSAIYPYVRGGCMEVIFKGMSPEAEAGMVAASAGGVGHFSTVQIGCAVEVLLYHSYSITCA